MEVKHPAKQRKVNNLPTIHKEYCRRSATETEQNSGKLGIYNPKQRKMGKRQRELTRWVLKVGCGGVIQGDQASLLAPKAWINHCL